MFFHIHILSIFFGSLDITNHGLHAKKEMREPQQLLFAGRPVADASIVIPPSKSIVVSHTYIIINPYIFCQ